MTNGCQDYKPPAAGFIYGEPHIVTFDGLKYTFPGKGYYVLVMNENPQNKLMIQVRLEQPDDTLWHAHVNATVITGVVMQENDSSIVQVFARKPLRRWRYKMVCFFYFIKKVKIIFRICMSMAPDDFLVCFFFSFPSSKLTPDAPHWKFQQYNGVSIRSPLLNMDMSDLVIMMRWELPFNKQFNYCFRSGVGVRVRESNGMLDVMVFLPPSYNTTCRSGQTATNANALPENRCYTTMG